eukprot:3904945-Prymnesium_polylepis.1
MATVRSSRRARGARLGTGWAGRGATGCGHLHVRECPALARGNTHHAARSHTHATRGWGARQRVVYDGTAVIPRHASTRRLRGR